MNAINHPAERTLSTAPRGLADVLGVTTAMRMIRRRLSLILAIGLLAAVGVFSFIMLQPATYSTAALLLIQPRQEITAPTAVAAQPPASPVESELELLRSPALMDDLAQALGMRGAGAATNSVEMDLASVIDVRQRGASGIVEIRARSGQAERAQLIANTYADVYLTSRINSQLGDPQAGGVGAERLAQLRQEAQDRETAAEALRAQVGDGNVESALGDLQSQVQQAQSDLATRQARYRRVQELRETGASLTAIAGALNSAQLNTLLDRSAQLDNELNDLNQRYFSTHPEVVAATAERTDLNRRIDQEIQRAAVELADQVSAARSRADSLQSALRNASAGLRGSASDSDRLRELETAAAESRRVYETFLERQQAISGQGLANRADARLLSYASLPAAPASPQLRVALALAIAASLLLGLGVGALVDMFDQSVKNADDLEAKVGHKAIASIPTISKRMMRQMPPAERHPSGYLVGRPMSAFTEALRVLRTVIVYSKLDFSVKVVAVTSALPNEGKTTISMCLARVAAMSGQKVCVVDCDLRMQSINDVIDIETDVGILQVLAGEAPWRSAIVRDPNSDAHVLPVASAGFTPRDVFGSEAMAKLIADLREHYDLVILDCAPILAVAETRILVAQADTTVLVARSGKTPVGAMRAAVAQTEGAGGSVLGIALNCVLPHWQTFSDSLYFDQSKSYYSVS